jgi:hypothetical protein
VSTLAQAALVWLLPLPAALLPAAYCHSTALALPEKGGHAVAEEQEGGSHQPIKGQHQRQAAGSRCRGGVGERGWE